MAFFNILFLFLCFSVSFGSIPDAVINNHHWLDTNNNFIHAHGGQITFFQNTYWWVGATQKLHNSQWLSSGINCYSSSDLNSWKFVATIFSNTSIKINHAGPYRIERPKIVFDSATSEYVMWFHLDTSSFAIQMVGVARSSSPCGKYEWVDGFQPDGLPSYDMGLWTDIDSQPAASYLVRSVKNQFAGISELNSKDTNVTGIISKGPRIEGQALFRYKDMYYLVGSHLTGWNPNPAVLCYADRSNLKNAEWIGCKNPTNSSTTYGSQSTYVMRFDGNTNGKKEHVFMFMADIWNHPDVGKATYLWLPFEFHSSKNLTLRFRDTWRLKDFVVQG